MKRRYTAALCLTLTLSTLSVTLGALGKDKPNYPEHGVVVAMRTEQETVGKVSHGTGKVRTIDVPVFKIRTADMDYEVKGKSLTVGDEVNFRIAKDKLYVQRADKEQRYSLVGQEKR